MASFAGRDEIKEYPGFVRRESSGYDKYYPADKQIQLYKPKPAPFYGQTTAGESYKRWEVQPKPRVDEDMTPPPHIPFSGTTTNRADFHAHPLERRQEREAVEYQPSNAPFYGQTTAVRVKKKKLFMVLYISSPPRGARRGHGATTTRSTPLSAAMLTTCVQGARRSTLRVTSERVPEI